MEVNLRPLTIKDFFGMIRRQKGWVVIILLGSIGLGFAAVMMTTPVYESTNTFFLDQGTRGSSNPNDPVGIMELPMPVLSIPNEIQKLQSDAMVRKATAEAGFNEAVIGNATPRVRAESINETNVIKVSVASTDPLLAKMVADMLPKVYSRMATDNRREAVQMSIQATSDKIKEQQSQLEEAEKKLRDYRAKYNLLPVSGLMTSRSNRVDDAEMSVEKSKTQVAVIQRQIAALEIEKSKEAGRKNTGARSVNTTAIETLKKEISDLEAERSVLLKRFLDDHPDVVALDVRIKEKKEDLRTTPRELNNDSSTNNPNIDSYNSQIAAARVQLKVAQKELSEAESWLAKAQGMLKGYQNVEGDESTMVQEVQGKKSNIESLSATLRVFQIKHQSVKDVIEEALSTGGQPAEKVKPREAQYLGIAILMGSFLAIGFAMLKDSIEDTVSSTDEIHTLTGLPSLGNIPSLPGRKGAGAIAPLNDRMLENFRVLRFNLLFSTLESPPKSIVVTSSGPGEGKTDFACNLAVAASGEGRRVILIDGNLKYPMIHKKMNIAGKPGLSDVVLGHATLDESLHPTAVPGLFVLTCGSQVQSPAELFASPAMTAFMRKLSDGSDLIIVDAPNCMSGADALVLSSVAESVLYVAKAGSTKRVAIRKGLDALRHANARVLGVAMNGAA